MHLRILFNSHSLSLSICLLVKSVDLLTAGLLEADSHSCSLPWADPESVKAHVEYLSHQSMWSKQPFGNNFWLRWWVYVHHTKNNKSSSFGKWKDALRPKNRPQWTRLKLWIERQICDHPLNGNHTENVLPCYAKWCTLSMYLDWEKTKNSMLDCTEQLLC